MGKYKKFRKSIVMRSGRVYELLWLFVLFYYGVPEFELAGQYDKF